MNLLDTVFGGHCRLCGQRGAATIGPVAPTHDGRFHTSEFTLVHCSKCKVVYLDPLPTAADLKLLYEQSVQFSDAHYTDPTQVEKILDYYATAVRRLNLLPKSKRSRRT